MKRPRAATALPAHPGLPFLAGKGYPKRTPEQVEQGIAEARAAIAKAPWGNVEQKRRAKAFRSFVRRHGIKDALTYMEEQGRRIAILDAGLVQLWDARGR